MTVLQFRKPSALTPKPPRVHSVREQVLAVQEDLSDLDVNGVIALAAEEHQATGDVAVTYTPLLELQLCRLCEKFGLPRLPFTADELNALLDYVQFLTSSRADRLPNNEAWQQSALKNAEKWRPEWVPALRFFFADNLAGLMELHRTTLPYERIVAVARRWWQ